jgi:hypothetical protein
MRITVAMAQAERLVLDTGEHYARPDLFQLSVHRERLALVRES